MINSPVGREAIDHRNLKTGSEPLSKGYSRTVYLYLGYRKVNTACTLGVYESKLYMQSAQVVVRKLDGFLLHLRLHGVDYDLRDRLALETWSTTM